MPLHGKNIVGNSLAAAGRRTYRAVDPSTGGQLETDFYDATEEEAERALELADRASRDRHPRDPDRDADLLQRIADNIEGLGDELIQRCGAETGLPAGRLKMERGRTCNQLRTFAKLVAEGSWVDARIDRAIPDRLPIPKPDVRRMLIPIGPVVVFPASNFPLAFSVAGGDTASALAAGCPVIVKARPAHPGTSELVARAVQEAMAAAGMPDGWFSMLHGPGRKLGLYLVRHPVVRAVGFTGSLSGGRALFDAAAAREDPIPVYAEMGSINPVFLLPGGLAANVQGPNVQRHGAEQIAAGLHQSVTLGVGQFCTNPGLVVAMECEQLDEFIGTLGKLIEETDPGTMLMEGMLSGYERGIEELASVPGVELAARAKPPAATCGKAAAALFVTDARTFLHDVRLSREVFGPSTIVVRCHSREQMLEIARRLEGQLTCTIHATEDELAGGGELLSTLERKAGRVLFGGFPTGVEVCASMHHGGPYPATSDVHFTSVGTSAIFRFARPVCYQNFPQSQLPPELRDRNQRGIWRLLDNVLSEDDV